MTLRRERHLPGKHRRSVNTMYYRNQPISCVLVTTQRVEKHEKKNNFMSQIYYFIFPTKYPIEYTHGKRCNGITQ